MQEMDNLQAAIAYLSKGGDDIESIHKLRVEARRLLSLSTKKDAIYPTLKMIMQLSNPIRDIDVFFLNLSKYLPKKLAKEIAKEKKLVLLQEERGELLRELQSYLATACLAPPSYKSKAKRGDKTLLEYQNLYELSPEALHEYRKKIKKVRYRITASDSKDERIKRLKEMQDLFGEMHDLFNMKNLLLETFGRENKIVKEALQIIEKIDSELLEKADKKLKKYTQKEQEMKKDIYSYIPTPCYVLEEELLAKNLEILDRVQKESGAKILLALKGFAMWSVFPQCAEVLHGITASGLHEAKLGHEEFKKEVHTYSPAFKAEDMEEILAISHHVVFNSFAQWERYREQCLNYPKKRSFGIRVNPEYSEVHPPIYNPCIIGSRLGTTRKEFRPEMLEGIEGLHFHTHCEQNSDSLERTLSHFEEKFGEFIPQMQWVNFGGGHHITREDYDLEKLIGLICDFKRRYDNIDVYLEPGEAVGWQTGFLIGEVLDIVNNGVDIAILDVSAAAHMPDCLEMPYRPDVRGSGEAGEKKHTYRFAGNTCLAGDVIGDYSFDASLKIGDRVIFEDMIHYTMVKNNTFNGVPLPSIGKIELDGSFALIKSFGYEDYKMRLS